MRHLISRTTASSQVSLKFTAPPGRAQAPGAVRADALRFSSST